MAIKVNIDIDREFTVKADVATAYALLSDVQASGAHFPKVEALTDKGDGVFLWEMEKVGLGDHAIQTVYASKYVGNDDTNEVTWTPIKGEGNGLVSGKWEITEGDGVTNLRLTTSAEMTLPLPGLLKLAIAPVVKHEFNSMVDEYIDNLKGALA